MANNQLKTVNVKGGGKYSMVFERINFFRGHTNGEDGQTWENGKGKDWGIETQIIEADDKHCLMKAVITNQDGRVMATGHAWENRDDKSSMVNKQSWIENGETSAMGRALANLGIGAQGTFASQDEVNIARAKEANSLVEEFANALGVDIKEQALGKAVQEAKEKIKALKSGSAGGSDDSALKAEIADLKRQLEAAKKNGGAVAEERLELPATWAKAYCDRLKGQTSKDAAQVIAEFVSNTLPMDFLKKNNPQMAAAMERNRAKSDGKAHNIPMTAMVDVINTHTQVVEAAAASGCYTKLIGEFIREKMPAKDLVKFFCGKNMKGKELFIPADKAMITAHLLDYLKKGGIEKAKQIEAFPFLQPSSETTEEEA